MSWTEIDVELPGVGMKVLGTYKTTGGAWYQTICYYEGDGLWTRGDGTFPITHWRIVGNPID